MSFRPIPTSESFNSLQSLDTPSAKESSCIQEEASFFLESASPFSLNPTVLFKSSDPRKREKYLTSALDKLKNAQAVKNTGLKKIFFGLKEEMDYADIIDWLGSVYKEASSNKQEAKQYTKVLLGIVRELNRISSDFELSLLDRVSKAFSCVFYGCSPVAKERFLSYCIAEDFLSEDI